MSPTDTELLVLDTGLFQDRETLSAALQTIKVPESQWHKLAPEVMNDTDWDQLLNLVLSTKCVITV